MTYRPRRKIDSNETRGDKDVEKETEPTALTPRKRKLAECADGILSTDDCPVCQTNDHKLVQDRGGRDEGPLR